MSGYNIMYTFADVDVCNIRKSPLSPYTALEVLTFVCGDRDYKTVRFTGSVKEKEEFSASAGFPYTLDFPVPIEEIREHMIEHFPEYLV